MVENESKFPSHLGRRAFVAGALATGAMAALSGCGKKEEEAPAPSTPAGSGDSADATAPAGEAPAGGPTKGGTLKYYINNPVSIDPFNAQETEGMQVCYNLFDTLTTYDFEAGELKGLAAESWEANDAADVFTFKLVQGATFHNGDPVTAKDFKFAWERVANPETNPGTPSDISYHLAAIKGYDEMLAGTGTELAIETPDDHTLVVTLAAPYADFPYVVTHPALSPVPSGGAADDFQTFFRAPVGNGPFKMEGEWVDSQYVKVVRNDDYYGDVALVDGIDFMIFKDPETAFTEFEAGNVDFCQIPSGRISDVVSRYGESEDGYTVQPGKQALLGAQLSTYYLAVNVEDEVMSNKDVRLAISYAINRQAICDTIFEGSRIPADGIVPPGIEGYKEGSWAAAKYDKAAAEQHLEAAGYPGGAGLEITLSVNSGGGHEQIMQLIQADLDAIGVKAEIQAEEWAAYLTSLSDGNYQIGRLGWVADYPIMENFLYPLFFSTSGDNRSQYKNPAVDEALTEARHTVDTAERIKLMQEADRLAGEDLPALPIMFYRHTYVGSARTNDLYFGPTNLAALHKCWLSE